MKNFFLLLILVFCALKITAQEECFIVKGRIFSEDSLTAIPYVNIVSELSHYGTVSNQDGWFLINSKTIDTLWVSCVGFERQRVPVAKDSIVDKELIIKLIRSNIMLDSVEIYPYPDYETFKQMIISMPSREPFFVPGLSKRNDEILIHKKPEIEPKVSGGSIISLIYNRFNKRERLKRKLERNRRKFNREMERIGADSLMIPK
ncbi:MAG: carboxypeptidase-like regulatory domain-containing protein [Bacteroidales bacterium]|nr:carboxypeptidase-like regulatory domain-containing protein [Bacteroidales bacterium]